MVSTFRCKNLQTFNSLAIGIFQHEQSQLLSKSLQKMALQKVLRFFIWGSINSHLRKQIQQAQNHLLFALWWRKSFCVPLQRFSFHLDQYNLGDRSSRYQSRYKLGYKEHEKKMYDAAMLYNWQGSELEDWLAGAHLSHLCGHYPCRSDQDHKVLVCKDEYTKGCFKEDAIDNGAIATFSDSSFYGQGRGNGQAAIHLLILYI
jgi:hypothetical protein